MFKREKYAGMVLYFWHGMRTRTWLALLRKNDYRFTFNCLPQIVSVSVMALLNSLLYRLSEALYASRLRNYTLPGPPLFVLGHWRTGTTYLHDLLACDPAFGYPTTYECFFPNHFLLTGPTARFGFALTLPKTRPQDNVAVGFDRPQEDEFALCNMGLPSNYVTWALPRRGPVDHSHLDLRDLPPAQKQAWIDGFLWFLKRVSYRAGKPLILKSPHHTARIATLLKLFPDARFVHIARDPCTVYASTLRLWRTMTSVQGLENPPHDEPWVEDYVLDTLDHMYKCYREDRELIPDGQLVEITYEDLVADPKGVLQNVYRALDLGDFARAEPQVDAYLENTSGYKTNTYVLPDDKQTLVRERWADYFRLFGYDATAAGRKAPAR